MRFWLAACVGLLSGTMCAQAVQTGAAAAGTAAPRRMAADADPSFAVASIRPNAGAGFSLVNLSPGRYVAHNVAVNDLVKFAYRLHANEVIGLPDWASQERYDITATTQPEGEPTLDQLRVMLKKMLAERFVMKLHTEQREMPVYVMSVARGGPKMKLAQGAGSGDVEREAEGGIQVIFRGTTTQGYAQFLQQAVVDRAVIDKTGLTERYDFDVTFLPDGSMFGGRMHIPPNVPNAAPSLFTALEEIGLKLSPEKLPVDVLVVDRVGRPLEN